MTQLPKSWVCPAHEERPQWRGSGGVGEYYIAAKERVFFQRALNNTAVFRIKKTGRKDFKNKHRGKGP